MPLAYARAFVDIAAFVRAAFLRPRDSQDVRNTVQYIRDKLGLVCAIKERWRVAVLCWCSGRISRRSRYQISVPRIFWTCSIVQKSCIKKFSISQFGSAHGDGTHDILAQQSPPFGNLIKTWSQPCPPAYDSAEPPRHIKIGGTEMGHF